MSSQDANSRGRDNLVESDSPLSPAGGGLRQTDVQDAFATADQSGAEVDALFRKISHLEQENSALQAQLKQRPAHMDQDIITITDQSTCNTLPTHGLTTSPQQVHNFHLE